MEQMVMSSESLSTKLKGGLDKVNYNLQKPVTVGTITLRAEKYGMAFEDRHFDEGQFLGLADGTNSIFLRLKYSDGVRWVDQVQSRPSAFESFDRYKEAQLLFLTPDELAMSKLARIDFYADYPEPFSRIIPGFDMFFKQIEDVYVSKSGELNGITAGGYPDRLSMYNWSLKHPDDQNPFGDDSPCTRIEKQIFSRELPIKLFSELPMLAKNNAANPFRGVILNDFVKYQQFPIGSLKQTRLQEIEVLAKAFGFYFARKRHDVQGNFERNYGRYIIRKERKDNPFNVYQKNLREFFGQATSAVL